MSVGTFTYYAYDLRTMTLLAELPFRGVTFGRLLNDSGAFNGELVLSDPRLANVNAVVATKPSRTLLAIDMDGQLIWCGIIWGRTFTNSTKVLKVTGKELWSYFEKRQQIDYTKPPGLSGNYWSTSPATTTTIAKQIIYDTLYDIGVGVPGPVMVATNMVHGTHYTSIALAAGFQSTPAPNALTAGTTLYLVDNNGGVQPVILNAPCAQGDTSLTVVSFTPNTTILGYDYWEPYSVSSPEVAVQIIPAQGWPPQMRLVDSIDTAVISQDTVSPTFPKQQRQTVEALVRQHAQAGVGTGFDFSVDSSWLMGPGGPIVTSCTFYFPTKGAAQYENVLSLGLNGLMVDLGAAIDYEWAEDGDSEATKVYAVAQATAYLEQDVTSSHALAQGYPLLEILFPYITINTTDELASAAEGELSMVAWPIQAPKVTLPALPPNEPSLGSFSLGDLMRLYTAATVTPQSFFPSGLDAPMRVIEWECSPADEGDATMELTFNIPPVLDPPDPTGMSL